MIELADGRRKSRRSGIALAESVRLLPAAGLRFSRRRLSHGTGAPHLCRRTAISRNQTENEIQWWIFWGRVAGGLNKNQQVDLFQRLSPVLLPRGQKKQRLNNSLLREMWRTAASLELLPIQTKTQLGDALLARAQKRAICATPRSGASRGIGARKLFYGPINQVIPGHDGDPLDRSAGQSARLRGRAGRDRTPHRRLDAGRFGGYLRAGAAIDSRIGLAGAGRRRG